MKAAFTRIMSVGFVNTKRATTSGDDEGELVEHDIQELWKKGVS